MRSSLLPDWVPMWPPGGSTPRSSSNTPVQVMSSSHDRPVAVEQAIAIWGADVPGAADNGAQDGPIGNKVIDRQETGEVYLCAMLDPEVPLGIINLLLRRCVDG